MIAAGATDEPMITAACDWLDSVATSDGGVPLSFPVMEGFPRAEHWTEWTYAPGLNPTAGIVGRLSKLGVTHPFVDHATAWCWAQLDAGFDEDAHSLKEVLLFLANVPDRARAESMAAQVPAWLAAAPYYRANADDPGYGQTPLHFAPEPNGPWSHLFDESTMNGHLDRLERDQQADGGWAITWEPPGVASTLDWRGIETVRALRILRAYGR